MRSFTATSRRSFRLRPRPLTAAAALITCLALPASSLAQATRTWVSGVGDDANPCSRTAPCKTWAGAISKTAVAGEIDALDPGGFGAVTITKSITLDGGPGIAGVLVSGTNGITVAAGGSDRVRLRNLDINGLNTGLSGVKFTSGASVEIDNSEIYEFTGQGVDFESTTPGARLVINNTTISQNAGAGVKAIAGSGGGNELAIIDNSNIDGNGCGLLAGGGCGGSPANALGVVISSRDTSITNNGTGAGAGRPGDGVYTTGSTAAQVLTGDLITGNTTGLSAGNSGTITSFGNNDVFGNNVNGTPTGAFAPEDRRLSAVRALMQKRAKRLARKRAEVRKHRHAHHS